MKDMTIIDNIAKQLIHLFNYVKKSIRYIYGRVLGPSKKFFFQFSEIVSQFFEIVTSIFEMLSQFFGDTISFFRY